MNLHEEIKKELEHKQQREKDFEEILKNYYSYDAVEGVTLTLDNGLKQLLVLDLDYHSSKTVISHYETTSFEKIFKDVVMKEFVRDIEYNDFYFMNYPWLSDYVIDNLDNNTQTDYSQEMQYIQYVSNWHTNHNVVYMEKMPNDFGEWEERDAKDIAQDIEPRKEGRLSTEELLVLKTFIDASQLEATTFIFRNFIGVPGTHHCYFEDLRDWDFPMDPLINWREGLDILAEYTDIHDWIEVWEEHDKSGLATLLNIYAKYEFDESQVFQGKDAEEIKEWVLAQVDGLEKEENEEDLVIE